MGKKRISVKKKIYEFSVVIEKILTTRDFKSGFIKTIEIINREKI